MHYQTMLPSVSRAPGIAFLDKALFTAYSFRSPSADRREDDEEPEIPPFEISLSSLLETLQIFGVNDVNSKDRWSTRHGSATSSFEPQKVLGMSGLCRLSYAAVGDPFCIILEEAGVTTNCELTTYEAPDLEEIPLQKDAIAQKIIMRADWLHDAVQEISTTSPKRLTISSSPQAPFFMLSSTGPLGSATIEFSKDAQLLETFNVPQRISNSYKYSLIKGASRAMAAASKVSIRSDEQGVLSLQFLIETEQDGKGPAFAFVDFRFVPYVDEEEEGDDGS